MAFTSFFYFFIFHFSEHASPARSNKPEPDPALQPPLEPSYGSNPKFPSASSILEMKNNSNYKGRHVITTKPIKLGDVLFSEVPFASILLPEHYSSHCHNCVSFFCYF